MGMNKKEQGAINLKKLQDKINRVREGEEKFPLNKKTGLVNRSALATELGFGRSVWAQNPECGKLLQAIEKEMFRAKGTSADTNDAQFEDESEELKRLRSRNLELEKKVASLMVENELVVSELEKLYMEDQKITNDGKIFDI